MMFYKSRKNEIIDGDGKQIAVVVKSNCTSREANMMAAFAAQQMNHEARNKECALQRKKLSAADAL